MVERQLDVNAMDPSNSISEEENFISEAPEEGTLQKSILDFLPKLQISEDWGVVGSEDRGVFEKYMNKIRGDSLPDKIKFINQFVSGESTEAFDISEVLSNLVFLELLSSVVEKFSPSGAGFLFEAFLAGMLRGTQVTEKVMGQLPIEDIRIFIDPETGSGGKAVSLKLLNPRIPVEGSITNLLKFLAFQDTENKGIEYLVVIKYGDKMLAFNSFTITRHNILNWIGNHFSSYQLNEALDDLDVTVLREQRQLLTEVEEFKYTKKELEKKWKEHGEALSKIANVAGLVQHVDPETGGKYAQAPRGRGARLRATQRMRGASEQEEELFKKYAKDANVPEGDINAVFDFDKDQMGEQEWDRILTKRRKMIKFMISNLSVKHPLGKPYTVDIGHSYREASRNLKYMATRNPKKWFELMQSAAIDTQFHIKPDRAHGALRLPKEMKRKRYGLIKIDKKEIKELAIRYNESLKELVIPIYQSLSAFETNVRDYFLEHNLEAADRAAQDASDLKEKAGMLAKQATQTVEK